VYVYTESGGVFDEIGSDSGGQDYGLFNDTPQTGYVDEGRAESFKGLWSGPSATPEPSTLALLGTGIVGLAGIALRRFPIT
jgi:hypothetical protein